ncbi:MAG: MoxR family ATPase [Planctomycetota bacterium]
MLDLQPTHHVTLESFDDCTERVHVFDEDSILAVNMAWSARRPLLVRGEPGVGKSQLAEAVARHTNRKFIPFVVDSKTEARDLLWRFDAIKRLADAQLIGAMRHPTPPASALQAAASNEPDKSEDDSNGFATIRDQISQQLAERNYVQPGPLWWAFDWQSAKTQDEVSHACSPYPQQTGDSANGCVVLIDEIDKAESDVPNGLLAALGAREFQPFGFDGKISVGDPPPLVIVTTNEERTLPDAFVRRCLVHFIDLPDDSEQELCDHLVPRGQVHFPEVAEEVLREAALQLHKDRKEAKGQNRRPYPGQAEYLDLVRAVRDQQGDTASQLALLRRASKFALKKNRGVTG